MSRTESRQLELTPEALETMAAMRARVAAVADHYGRGSTEHAEIADSLADVLARVFQLGGRIMRDGREDELCLLGDSFITYGVVFFPKRLDGDERDPLLGEWSVHN
jgi:hypothetical protein